MPCERKHIEAIRAWMNGLIHAAQIEIEKHPGDNASAAAALFYWADGPEQRAALAALAACDESPWRSMDDPLLPKDGTNILLCGGANVSQGGWLTGAMQGAEDESCAGWWAVGYIENPTHWMPLPAAPEAE